MPTTVEPRRLRWTKSPWLLPASAVVLGVVLGAAEYAHGDRSGGLASLAIMVVFAAVLTVFGHRSETVSLLRGDDVDERSSHIYLHALAVTGGVLCVVLATGLVVQTIRGGDAVVWSGLCAVGGASFGLAIVVLKRRL
jgi:hypothetical protein